MTEQFNLLGSVDILKKLICKWVAYIDMRQKLFWGVYLLINDYVLT